MIFIKFLFISSIFCIISGILFKYLFDYEAVPNLVEIENVENRVYDYIIVGAGTAGSVLAYELSKNTTDSVLLVEAGGNFNHLSIVPIFSTMMQGTHMDWSFKSVPQKYSSRGLENNQQSLPRGKGLGGCHQLNYLLHFTGIPSDFDRWSQNGATNWNYEKMKNFLDRHEFCCSCSLEKSSPDEPLLNIVDLERHESILGDAFLSAAEELNRKNQSVNFRLAKFTTKNGKRHSVYHEYLRRAFDHKNLNILMESQVLKIEFNSKNEVTSVLVQSTVEKTKKVRVFVNKEVILAAGAFQSPQILQLSGIGNREELTANGIKMVHESNDVGANLFDHMNFPLFVSINRAASVTLDKILSVQEIYKYLINSTGIWANTGVVGIGSVGDSGVLLFGMGSTDEKVLKAIANFKTDVFRAFFPFHYNSSQEGFVYLSTCHQPKSRGTVKLDPSNIWGPPLIDPNYLDDYRDVECIKRSIKLIVATLETEKFKAMNATINWPKIRECSNFGPFDGDFITNQPSDRYLDCIIRTGALTAHHPGGTCAIGKVVDNELRVQGVHKLRVVDGSVLPLVSGTPNSVILAVADRAAKIIKENQKTKN